MNAFIRNLVIILVFLSCNKGVEVELQSFNDFKYAPMLRSTESYAHYIYLEGYEYKTDYKDLQAFALHYIKGLESDNRLPKLLTLINKKASSADQLYGDYKIANVHVNCFNNKVYISNFVVYRNSKRSQKYYPREIEEQVDVQCR